jgi:hypothetical protein
MKLVINQCYGGFGLAGEAIWAYAKAKGREIRHGRFFSGAPPWLDEKKIPRNDPDLVEVLEVLGSDIASGPLADLSVEEIPDGTDWEIIEHDGLERVVFTRP